MTDFLFSSFSVAAEQGAGEVDNMLADAGVNTLLGMGMAFAVLILISLLISLFPLISMIGQRKEAPAPAVRTPEPAAPAIAEEEEELSDDEELVAVIAAAIAAYEGSAPVEGFQVRSIRRRRMNAR